MDVLLTLLNRFDATLRKYNLPSYGSLAPPLPKKERDGYLEKLEVDDSDFSAIYTWKDGVDITTGINHKGEIFCFGMLFSLESAYLSLELQFEFTPGMIPIIGLDDGDRLLFNNNRGQDYGRIFLFSAGMGYVDQPLDYFDSVTSMIETTILAYEQGALKYQDNYLHVDFDRFDPIAAPLNPRSSRWTGIS